MERKSAHLVHLTLADGSGAMGQIYSTPSHPYWVANRAAWISAEDIRPNDHFHDPHGQELIVTMVQTEALTTVARNVYNITVEEAHTYFVLPTGDTPRPILVHNANPLNCVGGTRARDLLRDNLG